MPYPTQNFVKNIHQIFFSKADDPAELSADSDVPYVIGIDSVSRQRRFL